MLTNFAKGLQTPVDQSNSDFWSVNPDAPKNLEALGAGTYAKPDANPLNNIDIKDLGINANPGISTSGVFSTSADKIAKAKADFAASEAAKRAEIEASAATQKEAAQRAIDAQFSQPIQEATQYREDITAATKGQFATDRRASTAALSFVDTRRGEAQKQINNLEKMKAEAMAKLDVNTQERIDKQLSDWRTYELQLNDYFRKIEQQDTDNYFKELEFGQKQQDSQAKQEMDLAKLSFDMDKFDYQQRQDNFNNVLASDKFSWQQKMDLIDSQLATNKFKLDTKKFNADQVKEAKDYELQLKKYQLDVQRAQDAATPEKYKEWQLAGGQSSGKSFAEFLMSGSGKPATADQQKNAGYAIRMQDSNSTIGLLTDKWKKLGLFSQAYQQTVPNWMKSSDIQMLEQAERDFINSKLRNESGAVISEPEFENARKQYFPQPGDSDAVIKQKERNRINALNGIIQSSGTALSDEFKTKAGQILYPDLQTYIDMNPDQSDYVKNIKDSYPDWSPDDVLQFIQNSGGTFNDVGGDTEKASEVISKVIEKPDGAKGGQCGAFVNRIAGVGVGDSYQSKMSKMDKAIKQPEPGMIFTMPYKENGHIGFILDVNDDGTATVKDSNYGLDEKIKTHKIAISRMTGFKRIS